MLKKTNIFVLFTFIFLVGCEYESLLSTDVYLRMETSKEMNLDTVPHIVQGLESVLLFETLDNELLNEFILPVEEMIVWGTRSIKNGYTGVFGVTGITDGLWSFPFPENSNITMFLYILDDELNLIDAFEITDKRLINDFHGSDIVYDSGNWLIYYAGMFSRNIYSYDIKNNETSLFFELNEGIFPSNVQFISTNQLGFNAGTGEEGSSILYYGVIHLETRALQLFELDAVGFHSGSAVHDYYVLFPAIVTADFQAKIIVLDLQTGNYQKIQLDDYESSAAQIIGNGRFILTRNRDWEKGEIRTRVYNLYTGDILFQNDTLISELGLHESEEIVFTEYIMLEEGIYAIVNGIATVAEREVRVEDFRFHVNFIIIEEVE